MSAAYFIGIDIGTQGARVVMLDDNGLQVGSNEEVFPLNKENRNEQPPLQWWKSCLNSLKMMCTEVSGSIDLKNIKAISVASTSGTIIPLNKNNEPLHQAIMYSDTRSAAEASVCRKAAEDAGTTAYS